MIGVAAYGWDFYQFDLPSQAPESAWRDALATKLNAKHEVPIEAGRVDVLTDKEVIELDWPHKWHEGLGQVLHYSDALGKQPVLALISYSQGPDNLRPASRERFDIVEQTCLKHGVKLLVLFPSQPRVESPGDGNLNDSGKVENAPTNFWLNTQTGVRHRAGCRFYGKSLEGHPCGENEGKPCSLCGGKS